MHARSSENATLPYRRLTVTGSLPGKRFVERGARSYLPLALGPSAGVALQALFGASSTS
jgi:hypothetical protein